MKIFFYGLVLVWMEETETVNEHRWEEGGWMQLLTTKKLPQMDEVCMSRMEKGMKFLSLKH